MLQNWLFLVRDIAVFLNVTIGFAQQKTNAMHLHRSAIVAKAAEIYNIIKLTQN